MMREQSGAGEPCHIISEVSWAGPAAQPCMEPRASEQTSRTSPNGTEARESVWCAWGKGL